MFFSGYRFEKRLAAGGADDYVLVFRKGSELRVAAWTTSGNHNVLMPLNAGRYTSIKHTGEKSGDVTARANGATINLTSAPVYLQTRDNNK